MRLRWFEQWALWGVLVFVLAVIVAVVLIERAYAAQSAAAYADRDRVGLRRGRPRRASLLLGRPSANQIQDRRDLLSVVRHIGEERERFLAWYDHPDARRCATASAIP